MGTSYRVTVVSSQPVSGDALRDQIDRRLEEVNRHMSTWIEDSEISRFNRDAAVGEVFPISPDFHRVMVAAAEAFTLSGGAWDGTVGPLVDLWGFGPTGRGEGVPTAEDIDEVLERVGFDQIEIREGGALVKRHPSVALDLSSIAKGYGVDAVVSVLREEGIEDALVEIGGEVFAAGRRRDGGPWRVGINRPDPDAGIRDVYKVVALSDRALATSGDYRNFLVEDGVRRSHVLDPRTGHPVTGGVVSVSVVAPTAMQADGLATAVMVMGVEEGLTLVEDLAGVEALVVTERQRGVLEERASSGFVAQTPSK